MIPTPVRIACVGASITFGLGLPNRREECYPAVVGRLLGGSYAVRNFGYSGAAAGRSTNEPYWETPSLLAAARFRPDLVVLMLGTNDAQHANRSSLATFADDYAALIDLFRGWAGSPVVGVILPPPVFEPMAEIDIRALDTRVRPAVENIARRARLPVIDGYEPLRKRGDLFPDNLHPDAEGARLLANDVAAVIDRLNLDVN